jgi:phage head maturation protease
MTAPHAAEIKAFGALSVKDADKGLVQAVIATLEVVDRDGDIIRKGAIANGTKVTMSAYGHDAVFGARPAGKGVLSVEGNQLTFNGRMFLATTAGRETFEVLKELDTAEWSFGFRVLGEEVPNESERKQGARRVLTKLDAFEVSPVLMGAGVGTRTVAVKDAGDPEQAELRAICEKIRADYERRELERQREEARAIGRKVLRDLAEREERERTEFLRECESAAHDHDRINQQIAAQQLLTEMQSKWGRGARHLLQTVSQYPITRPEIWPLLKFIAREMEIPAEALPSVGLVPRWALPSDTTTGVYFGKANAVYVADDLDGETLAKTVIHECYHALEARKGWGGNEDFAFATERALYDRWRRLEAA